MTMFSKRLTCFYCGARPAKSILDSNNKFHCDHCDADNFLDQNGEITDPPNEITNPVQNVGASNERIEQFPESELFCSQCLRNQHLLTSSLAAFVPEDDERIDRQFDSSYASYRQELETLYPQVCESCEPRVKQRIREAGYEAKADNLRRMMDQTRASKAVQRARQHSWQSFLVYLGALGFWISILGQLAWDTIGVLTLYPVQNDADMSIDTPMSLLLRVRQMIALRGIPHEYSFDLASIAGKALVAGCLSLWWNPKLRMKVYGRPGRFSGLGEYYQLQLFSLVLRCVFWSLFKDPSASGIDPKGSFVGHTVMAGITILCILASRHVVKYDRRTLVDWSDHSWENVPMRSPTSSPSARHRTSNPDMTPKATNGGTREPFPIALLSPQSAVTRTSAFPTPPPESDDMDWTPSRTHEIRPTVSIHQRDKPSVFEGPNPFYGSIPAVPKPPAWQLRTQPSNKPIEQVVERNPFHRSPTNSPTSWQHKSASPAPVFKPPTFFPSSDHNSFTGLETLFDRTFSIDPNNTPRRSEQQQSRHCHPRTSRSSRIQRRALLPLFRFLLLLLSIGAWAFSQNRMLPIHGNYIETFALGSASLIAGLTFLEAVKKPISEWRGLELLVNITELIVAVHLGAHLPKQFTDREYFDRYGKLLLIFMAVQEVMALLAIFRTPTIPVKPAAGAQSGPTSPVGSPQYERPQLEATVYSPTSSATTLSPTYNSFKYAPSSFETSTGSSNLSSALPSSFSSQSLHSYHPHHPQHRNPHSFTMQSLKESEPSDYEQDSDSETVATNTTGWTNTTNRNIRYGHRPSTAQSNDNFFSPRRNQLTPGLGGLSLEDRPNSRRMTRSQTQQGLNGRGLSSRATRW
ncbi:uncharacterized protein N7484_003851 [Penicillium longicatenatum]|uniref:uncharacterized protein n=1 Tax=Penicillium longicatenatum TaxID=1561947 RepID=UPI0025493DC4|nr:uncharacterized protein N7484_003851 [Penicillium longicatenatum]KAJ5650128.1 hypothetical protein N7484_003851 [Penicillium longicatenatum]